MSRTCKKSFVEDVNMGESRSAYDWLFTLYKKLKNASMNIGELMESAKVCDNNCIIRERSHSL